MSVNRKSILKKLLRVEGDFKVSDVFYKKTSIRLLPKEGGKQVVPDSWIKINYKTYPRLKRVDLPKPADLSISLEKAIVWRRSRRDYLNRPLDIKQLSSLVYFSAGIVKKYINWDKSLRAYPSAGGRYPLELYLIINNVGSVDRGLYHYNVKENCLELLYKRNLREEVGHLTGQDFVKEAQVILVLTGVFDRTRVKYEDRGFRYILMECGHLFQNVYLVSEAFNLSCCAIGGFIDDKLNSLLDIQHTSEKVLYLMAVGNRAKDKAKI